jgi:hypothetical protein
MKKLLSVFSTFFAGFLFYSAWAGYIEEEFKITEYKGYIVNKFQSEQVSDMGTVYITNQNYQIVFSTGQSLAVPLSIYQKVNKGEYKVLLEQNNHITVSK